VADLPPRAANDEQSSNAGGLPSGRCLLLVPIGFFLLVIQGISELIKRIGFLKGLSPTRPKKQGVKPTPEEELALANQGAEGQEEP
jgi:TRAP-type mannitol/chloroaromatic compound transport system permease small subunit